jgi:hypothetical protein
MMRALPWLLGTLMVAGCTDTPAITDADPKENDSQATSQRDAVAQQKLTIEQAAEEATKLVEADAKAEIDAAKANGSEPAQ